MAGRTGGAGPASAEKLLPMEVTPVIIDTDPGLDDAIAILMALAMPEIAIRGITTVAGNIGLDLTTRNAGSLLALAGREDIPVIAGAAVPLSKGAEQASHIHGNDGLGGVRLPDPLRAPLAEDAVDWTARRIATEPGGLTLLTLGPLTNIAALLRRYPDAKRGIRRVVAMGGAVREAGNVGPKSEFNFAFDPQAVAEVMSAGLDFTLIPLDVTRRVRATPAWTNPLAASGKVAAKATADFVNAYLDGTRESRPLHDPCVPAFVLAPELFSSERLRLRIQTGSGTPDDGATLIDPTGTETTVLTGVDSPAVLELLARRLKSI